MTRHTALTKKWSKFCKNNNIEKDEHGFIKDCKTVYLQEDILKKIEEILDGTFDMIE